MAEKKIAIVQTPKNQIVQQDNSVNDLISQAISTNVPVETLERLFALREKIKAEQAKEAFDSAMAKFQGECPIIEKTKDGGKTKSGIVAYKYAPIESIIQQTKQLLKENGFSYAIQTETGTDKVKATCIAKHELGHSEPTSVEVPLGTKTDIMSAPQVVASALTFAKRYAFCNAFGIMTGDEDIDAKNDKENSKSIEVESCKNKLEQATTIEQLKEIWKNELTADERNSEEVKALYVSHLSVIKSSQNIDSGKE